MRSEYQVKSTKGNLTGTQIRLARICELSWPDNPYYRRPRVMSVRNEADILDYVLRILRIRDQARIDKVNIYTKAEDELLHLQQGKLPTAIQLRAAFDYRVSPSVRVAEACYGGQYAPLPSMILHDFEQSTGWPAAAFESKLEGDWLERWNWMKQREAEQRS